jgi:hypothetical protein
MDGRAMSRYMLEPIKPEHQGCEVAVGWDGTLGNFFFEVRRPPDNDFSFGEAVISIAVLKHTAPFGGDFNRVMKAISEYAVIEPNSNWRATLWGDKENEGAKLRA